MNVAAQPSAPSPLNSQKRRRGHLAHARYKGREGADHRHKAGDDDSLAPVPLVEALGGFDMLALDDPARLRSDHLAKEPSDGVVDRVARYGSRDHHKRDDPESDRPVPAKASAANSRESPRQKRSKHETGFRGRIVEAVRVDPNAHVPNGV